jgi:hypothetical protein
LLSGKFDTSRRDLIDGAAGGCEHRLGFRFDIGSIRGMSVASVWNVGRLEPDC